MVVWPGLSNSQSIGYSYTALSKRIKITTLKYYIKDVGDGAAGWAQAGFGRSLNQVRLSTLYIYNSGIKFEEKVVNDFTVFTQV